MRSNRFCWYFTAFSLINLFMDSEAVFTLEKIDSNKSETLYSCYNNLCYSNPCYSKSNKGRARFNTNIILQTDYITNCIFPELINIEEQSELISSISYNFFSIIYNVFICVRAASLKTFLDIFARNNKKSMFAKSLIFFRLCLLIMALFISTIAFIIYC